MSALIQSQHVAEISKLESPEQARSMISKVYDAGQAIRETPVPTIAQIEGRCYGAGLELAASCDFRYATKDSHFAMPEVELGVGPPLIGNTDPGALLCQGWQD